MVHIDRAPVRPGWSRGWVQVAVFIYYAAGATSILLNGAVDFPLARFVEAVATDASFSLEMAAVVSSLLLALGQFPGARTHGFYRSCCFIARSPKKGNEIQRCWRLYELSCCASNGPDLLIRHASIISFS